MNSLNLIALLILDIGMANAWIEIVIQVGVIVKIVVVDALIKV